MGIEETVSPELNPPTPAPSSNKNPVASTGPQGPGGISLEEYLLGDLRPEHRGTLSGFVATHENLVSRIVGYGTSLALVVGAGAIAFSGAKPDPSYVPDPQVIDYINALAVPAAAIIVGGIGIGRLVRRQIFSRFSGLNSKPTHTELSPSTSEKPNIQKPTNPYPHPSPWKTAAGGIAADAAFSYVTGTPFDLAHIIGILGIGAGMGISAGEAWRGMRFALSRPVREQAKSQASRGLHIPFPKRHAQRLEDDRQKYHNLSDHFQMLAKKARTGQYREALSLAEETPRMSNLLANDPLAPLSLSMEMAYGQYKGLRKHPELPIGYQTLGLTFHSYRKYEHARAALHAAAMRINTTDPERAAREHLLQSIFSNLSGLELEAIAHLGEGARYALQTSAFKHRQTIEGHDIIILTDDEFKQSFLFRPGTHQDLENELRWCRQAKALEQDFLKTLTHLGIASSEIGELGVLRYTKAPTVRSVLEHQYDAILHEHMARAVGYLAGAFHPTGLRHVDAATYALDQLRSNTNIQVDEPLAHDALSILAKTLAGSPLVADLDSHTEQFLAISTGKTVQLERIDIQATERELAFSLSKAIERSPYTGKSTEETAAIKRNLQRAIIDEYNAAAGAHLNAEEQAYAKLGADVFSGITYGAKRTRQALLPQVLESLKAGLSSLDELLGIQGDALTQPERSILSRFKNAVYEPLYASCRKLAA